MDNTVINKHQNYSQNNLIWIDLEMTGINPEQNHILEIGMVVTNQNLDIISDHFNKIIYQPVENLTNMPKVVVDMHTKNGLLDLVSSSSLSLPDVEIMAVDFIQQYVPKNTSPICGNSICLDRRFLFNYMPSLENFFHYRQLDVSTIKSLAKYWYADQISEFKKDDKNDSKHRAISDVLQSIEELKFYKDNIFI